MTRIVLALSTLFLGVSAPAAQAPSPPVVDAVFASSASSKAPIAGAGFNAVTVNPYVADLNAIAAHGLGGIVWLQGYDNGSCRFAKADSWVREKIKAIKNHAAVVAYHIDDEPKSTDCPGAPAQVAGRSALVKSLDPGSLTLITHYRDYEFDDFAGTVDVLGVVSYPCSIKSGCRYEKITQDVQSARNAGWQRLWAVPQVFGNDYYRVPTPSELETILATWDDAGVEGSLAYTWDKTDPDTLSMHPELQPAFRGR
jgi:hypothetical protein